MRKAWVALVLVGLAVMGLVLVNLPAHTSAQDSGLPMNDPIWRPVLQVTTLVLALGFYAALVAAIVQIVRDVFRTESRPNWIQFALVTGGSVSVYAILLNVLGVMLPFEGYSGDQFLVGTLPLLLAGVVGVIAAYMSGTIRFGVVAGLLAGLLYEVVSQLSWVLVAALAWPAIQHGMLSSGVESDFQRFVQTTGRVPDLGTFLHLELLEDGIGLPIIFGLIGLTLDGMCAALGAAIGAALSRADAQRRQVTTSATQPILWTRLPVTLLLTALLLDLLVWITTVEFNALGVAHRV